MESIHARRIHSEESFPYVDFHVKLIMDFISGCYFFELFGWQFAQSFIFFFHVKLIMDFISGCYFFELFGWQFAQSFIFLNDHMTRPAFPACDFFDKQ